MTIEEIYQQYSDNPIQWMEKNSCVTTKDISLKLMKLAIQAAIPLILIEVAEKVETTSIYRPNCNDHTPYWGACVSCGRTDNPDILIGEVVNKQGILDLQKELEEKLLK